MSEITLCVDTESVRHPEIIGLDGERLDAQSWLSLCTNGAHARQLIGADKAKEVWVAGSDDIDPINLAATLKRDGSASKVCLLAFQKTGSLFSRAQAAGIDEILDRPAFASRYLAYKRFAYAQAEGLDEETFGATSARAHVRQESETAPIVIQVKEADQEPQTAEAIQSVKTTSSAETVSKPKGFMLAVIGAGGGVGKSSVSTLIACASQRAGLSTVLVDADLQFGDIHYLMGIESPLTLDAAVAAPARLDTLERGGNAPAVLAAPAHLEQSEVVFDQLQSIIERLRQSFDVVIVNTSSWYNDAQMQVIEQATNVLFVLDQRPSSVRACRHALELCTRCGIAAQPFMFVLNRCSRHALFSSLDISCALKGVHVDELQDGGREVEELLGAGQPFDLLDSKNAFATSIVQLASEILPKPKDMPAVTIKMPPSKRRGRFAARRKKAACL